MIFGLFEKYEYLKKLLRLLTTQLNEKSMATFIPSSGHTGCNNNNRFETIFNRNFSSKSSESRKSSFREHRNKRLRQL